LRHVRGGSIQADAGVSRTVELAVARPMPTLVPTMTTV
jgi:hypothetical protein